MAGSAEDRVRWLKAKLIKILYLTIAVLDFRDSIKSSGSIGDVGRITCGRVCERGHSEGKTGMTLSQG